MTLAMGSPLGGGMAAASLDAWTAGAAPPPRTALPWMVAKRVAGDRVTTRGESTRACGDVDGCCARAGIEAARTRAATVMYAVRFIEPQTYYRPESAKAE